MRRNSYEARPPIAAPLHNHARAPARPHAFRSTTFARMRQRRDNLLVAIACVPAAVLLWWLVAPLL